VLSVEGGNLDYQRPWVTLARRRRVDVAARRLVLLEVRAKSVFVAVESGELLGLVSRHRERHIGALYRPINCLKSDIRER
jgi:hypothetical protein